jgi:hypothetical protein
MSPRRKRHALSRPLNRAVTKHLDVARERVLWASGIVDCCAYATESLLVSKNGRPNFQYALEGAHALLETAAGNLIDVLDDEMPSDGDQP